MPGIKRMAIACRSPDVPACHQLHLLLLSLSVTLPSSFLYFFVYLSIFHMHRCFTCICESVHIRAQRSQKESSDLLELKVTDVAGPLCGCWESNPDPL